MEYKKILTIQDISCVGQCSLTVALPILSACGMETCILPSAVLSTHSAGFGEFTFHDLTEDMPRIREHWVRAGICFEAIYTGYLGSVKQMAYIQDIFRDNLKPGGLKIIDPAMADQGKLYSGFDVEFVDAMKEFCKDGDYILPNITEAALLTDTEYRTEYDRDYIELLLQRLVDIGCKTVVLTGVSFEKGKTGVAVYENQCYSYYAHEKYERTCHGSGDIYASSFVGALLHGKTTYEAAKIAAQYTLDCVRVTVDDESHWYGSKFELVLPNLINALKES